jgi:hypothetical protein
MRGDALATPSSQTEQTVARLRATGSSLHVSQCCDIFRETLAGYDRLPNQTEEADPATKKGGVPMRMPLRPAQFTPIKEAYHFVEKQH